MAFPTVAATGTGHTSTSNTQSKTVNCPAHSAADRLVLMMAMDGDPDNISVSDVQGTTDDSWALRFESLNGPSMRLMVYEVVTRAASGSSQDITVSWTTQGEMIAAQIIAVSGSHTTELLQTSVEVDGTNSDPNPQSFSPSWGSADTLWLALCGYDNGTITVTSYPSSFTNGTNVRSNSSSGVGIGYARREQAVSSQNPGAFDLSGPDGWVALTLAIRPSAGGGGTTQTIPVGVVSEFEEPLAVTVAQAGMPEPEEAEPIPRTREARAEMLEASVVSYSLSRVEVLSQNDEIEHDNISGNVRACTIEHGGFRNIHRIITIELDKELDWGRQRIKPYLTVEGAGWVDTLPLGVFCLTAPVRTGGLRPPQWSVNGFDKMYLIDQPLALPVSYPTGSPILANVRELLSLRGIQVDRISNDRASDVLSQVHSWGVEQNFTYLQVINDLLAMVGYRGLRLDPDGFPESGPHPSARSRNITWRYDAGSPTTTVYLSGREHVDDYTDRPNRWVFWANNIDADQPPIEGDGLYIVDNHTEGSSSQQARGGLVITRAEGIEAITQADLEANGQRLVDEDMMSSATVRLTTSINPYHDHQDILEVIDRDLGIAGTFEETVWSMDIFARTMTHELRAISGGII